MKVKFSKKITYYPTWNGNTPEGDDAFMVTLEPCSFGELLDLVEALGNAGIQGQELDSGQIDVKHIQPLINSYGHLIAKYVEIKGLEGQDGEITIQDVVRYGAFLGLAVELLSKLTEISSPSEEDEKN